MQIFIILSSCENWVTQISKILIQLDSSHTQNDKNLHIFYSNSLVILSILAYHT